MSYIKDYSVIDLLKNYTRFKLEISILSNKRLKPEEREKLDNLAKQLENLDEAMKIIPIEERDLLDNLFIQKISARKLSKKICFSLTTILTRKQKAIANLESKIRWLI